MSVSLQPVLYELVSAPLRLQGRGGQPNALITLLRPHTCHPRKQWRQAVGEEEIAHQVELDANTEWPDAAAQRRVSYIGSIST